MPFILTLIAGLSTLLGTIFIFIKIKNEQKLISCSLSFAAGVMICISFTDLIPESSKLLLKTFNIIPTILICMIFVSLGIIISMTIDKLVPSSDNLYRVGVISMLAIILHNIPEGIATFMATSHDLKLGISLTLAIALHNIPEGISISIPIYYATKSRFKALGYTFISGLSEFLGAIITFFFLSNLINDIFMGIIFSLIAGIMIHISIYELLPTSIKYKNKLLTIGFFIIGIMFMLINHFLFI